MTAHRHLLFGFCMETDYLFRTPMTAAPHDKAVDLQFRLTRFAYPRALLPGTCLYHSPDNNSFGESIVQLYAMPSGVVMRFPRVADFRLTPGEIHCELCDPGLEYMIEVCLLGHVMSYYLELSGMVALHAGAVAVGGRAVLFAADRTGGKSTLVASMVEAGFPLLADDIAALEARNGRVVCRHGFPQIKLTPEQALRFAGHTDGFPLVHPAFSKLSVPAREVGAVAAASLPVSRVYLLERRTDDVDNACGIQIESVPAGGALIQLVRHSFLAKILEGHGGFSNFVAGDGEVRTGGEDVRVSRFHRLVKIAQYVPVKRLHYPSGYERLSQVHSAVLADLNLPSKRGYKFRA